MSHGDDAQTSLYAIINQYFVFGDLFNDLYVIGSYA